MPEEQIPLWRDRRVIENALKYCKESYNKEKEVNPEKRVKTDFESVLFKSENADKKSDDQKCIFALCENPTLSKKGEPWRDLYIAFRGTNVNDYEDILTDIEITQVADESWALDDIKFHGGFLKRSKLCIGNEKQGILAKIDEFGYKPNRVILTGYSLGAAVSALVYIQLSKKQAELEWDLCNITFACPMFGNKALKQYMANQEKQFDKMYHFVKEGDIIPGACFAEHAFDQLGRQIKRVIGHIADDKWQGILGNKILTKEVESLKQVSTKEEKQQIDEIVETGKTIIAGLWNNEVKYNYEPIGCYITDRDEGWVELIKNIKETLKKDLKIISEFSSTNMDWNKIIAKQIGAFHALDGYETLIMKWMKKGTNMHS